MVRSVNIARTDQLVWGMVKDALRDLRDRSPSTCDDERIEQHGRDDRDGILSDGITWISPEQVDLLPDDEKRVVIEKLVSRITVHFDRESNRHRVDVEFSDLVNGMSGLAPGEKSEEEAGGEAREVAPQDGGGNAGERGEDSLGKKSGVGGVSSPTDQTYSVTVE